MKPKDMEPAPKSSCSRPGRRRKAFLAAALLFALQTLAAAGSQGYGSDVSLDGLPVAPDQSTVTTQPVDTTPPVAIPQLEATTEPSEAVTTPATVQPEAFPAAYEPLLSCGILVDGLSYDLPMAWGQAEFETARASYLNSEGRKDLVAIMAKALPYLSFVEAKVEEYGLPKELAYLPIIESEYSPMAVSTSGATGLWQFMRNSITGYGLSISEWVDDRKDFMKSTDAALRKLKDNKEALSDDWLLALAAYNAGLGAVSRAVATEGGKNLDFWHLYDSRKLARETLSYVPRFLAVASILLYPGLHGFPTEWGEKANWEAIETTRQVDMNVLSEKAGIPLALLKAGNAELKYHITPPAAKYMLKVPADKAEKVRTILADSSAPLYRYDIYKVKSGDTMGAIAKRYDAPLSIILGANPGLKANKISIGQVLIIPHIPGTVQTTIAKASPAAAGSRYTVRIGDTLWAIALKFGTKVEELAKVNRLAVGDILRIGQMLKIPNS